MLVGGGLLLYWGAEWFVGGASSLAVSLRVPKIFVGLTVVAYGTSAPEIIVGIQAAAAGHADVALGNVLGSNIANIGLILGVAAILAPATVDGALRTRELPMLVATTLVIPLLLIDGVVSNIEAGALLVAAVAYTGWMVWAARRPVTLEKAALDTAVIAAAADVAGAPGGAADGDGPPMGTAKAVVVGVVGLVVLLVGGTIFVDGAVDIARTFGMSDRLVGLTIVAVGTSLPELVSSVVAARRGHGDIAVGNVLGSNIFNVLLCLGSAGLAGTITATLESVAVELVFLGVMTLMAIVFMRTARIITRPEGAIALVCYAIFMVQTIMRG
jgi:cation:H+ antiporter